MREKSEFALKAVARRGRGKGKRESKDGASSVEKDKPSLVHIWWTVAQMTPPHTYPTAVLSSVQKKQPLICGM